MKRILVPCDFSKYSETALIFALQLATQIEGELLVVNVVPESSSTPITSELKIHALESLTRLVKSCQSPGVIVQKKILSGRFLTSVLKSVKDDNINLIVMGTRGSRGWGEYFMGSNIEKIVRTSPVPVFAVRGSMNPKSINDIVFPCDMKLNQLEMIEQIKHLQTLFHARLQILRINTSSTSSDGKIIEKLEQYAKHYQLSNFRITVLKNKNVTEGILHFTREANADMIAMITRRKRDLKHLFTNSTTADVVNHANVLVWTCCSDQLPAKTSTKNDDQ
ncbi:MAG: universal stress protein [Dyadobacter sp.]|uniref:universal stress protein n=1 Tax=Dyadobacter sp. TaxID=1914288 RepID=UPI003265E43B